MVDQPPVVQHAPWIGGKTVAHEGPWIDVVDPTNERRVAVVADAGANVVDLAVDEATRAQRTWAGRPTSERAAVLDGLTVAVRANLEELIDADCRETGKPRGLAMDEMLGAARYFEYYAAELRTLTGETIEVSDDEHTFVQRVPFGVVGVIVPWNYATNQTARSIAPAIATGNAVVVKPSEHASSAVLLLARLAEDAGLPAGILNVVTGAANAGSAVVEHPGVHRISFTGSVATGIEIADMAAKRLTPVGLELGGKSPHIVFEDADLDRASQVIVENFTMFAGQTCSAGTRVLVHASVAGELTRRVVSRSEALSTTDAVGPLISRNQRSAVAQAVRGAIAEGATCEVGGEAAPRDGFYFKATVLSDVTPQMRMFRHEVFGPVLTVTRFESDDEAISLANDSPYGLAAAVWTRDISRSFRVGSAMRCGQVFVNKWGASERVPFGGFGASGLGREKGSAAMHEYTQIRATSVQL